MIYAYARVSSRDQNLDRQIASFVSFGVDKRSIFTDKQSGKDFERKSYSRLMKRLKPGDLLVIKSIDRLGRNYTAIIEQWRKIVNEIGADILVLDMPLLDTREKQSSLVGKFISDVVLQVLSFVAENERANIRLRQAEGIAAAKARGIKFGRPSKKYSPDFLELVSAFHNKLVALPEALAAAKMSRSNFYYHYYILKRKGCIKTNSAPTDGNIAPRRPD